MTRNQALLAVHVGALMFGLSGIFGKLAETTPWAITAGRALFAVIALALLTRLLTQRNGGNPSRRQLSLLALGGLLLAGHWATFFHSVQVSGVAIATLGFASFPAFTLLLEGLLFRERLQWQEFMVVTLVCGGLVLVTPEFSWASQSTHGLLWAILSGLLFSLLSLLNRISTRNVDSVRAALWQNLVILLVLCPLLWQEVGNISAMSWLWIALLGILCTGLAHSLFVAALKVLNARSTAVIFGLEPVYGIALAWLLFQEQPTLRMLAGGALVIMAIIISARLGSPAPKSRAVQTS